MVGQGTLGLGYFHSDTASPEIYTLSLHDALPICPGLPGRDGRARAHRVPAGGDRGGARDRKSTRLNSSHGYISYAVFCLKKKTHQLTTPPTTARRRHRPPPCSATAPSSHTLFVAS